MEDFRSKSCRDARNMQMESYSNNNNNNNNNNNGGGAGGRQYGPTNMHDLRSFSTTHASSVNQQPPNHNYMMGVGKEVQLKKSKNGLGGSSSGKSWSFNDPELQRKKRVAGYKVYSVEGKMKGSLRKSFRWIKDIVYGWR